MEKKLAVQLFTVREEMKEGIRPLFKTLKQQGWSGVELGAMPEGYDPEEVALALKENDLQAVGMHVPIDQLTSDLPSVLKEADLYGTKDIICPFLPEDLRNEAGYREIKTTLNRLAKEAPGYRISYHNHDFEFDTTVGEENALRYLLDPADDNQILAEIDVYWVKKAGENPLQFMKSYSQRMPNLHLKDMTNDDLQTFAEIGEGSIDFLPILEWGEGNGVEWYVVEQDLSQRTPLESLKMSFNHLMELNNQLKK